MQTKSPRRDARSSHSETFWLLGITAVLIAGFFLRVIFYNGPGGGDDLRYLQFSEELLRQHGLSHLDHAASRLVLLALVGFPAVIGGNFFFGAFFNILYATLAYLVAVLFVYRNFGARACFVAAAYLAFAGTTMVYAGGILPEALLTLFMVLAAILIYESLRGPAINFAFIVAAGVLTGIAYSSKDTGILLLAPVFLYTAFAKDFDISQRARAYGLYLCGFVFYWLLDSFAYLLLSGDFFYKIRAIKEIHNATMVEASSLFDFIRRSWWNAYQIFTEWDYLLVPLALAVPAWVLLLVKDRRLSLFAVTGLFVLAFLIGGSSSLTRLVNLPFQERYIQPVLPFAAIALGYATTLLPQVRFQSAVIVGMALVLLMLGVGGAVQRAGNLYFAEAMRTAATYVESLPADSAPVFVDLRMHRTLRQLLPADMYNRVRLFAAGQPLQPGYYLFYRFRTGQRITEFASVRDEPEMKIVTTLSLDQRVAYRYVPLSAQPRYVVEVGRYR